MFCLCNGRQTASLFKSHNFFSTLACRDLREIYPHIWRLPCVSVFPAVVASNDFSNSDKELTEHGIKRENTSILYSWFLPRFKDVRQLKRDLTDWELGATPARIEQRDKSKDREGRMPADPFERCKNVTYVSTEV